MPLSIGVSRFVEYKLDSDRMKILGYAASAATVLSLLFAVWTYKYPAEAESKLKQEIVPAVTGDNNVTIVGDSNVVQPQSSSMKPDATEPGKYKEKLSEITTRLSRRKVEELFGVPSFESKLAGENARIATFVTPDFFLKVIFSTDENVVFYSVTTRSDGFRPEIPYSEMRLLQSKFSEIGEAEHLYSYLSSKHYEYAERIYLGNPGNYRTLYLGYCSSGVYPDFDGFFPPVVVDDDGAESWRKFRQSVGPNCYGVGDITGGEEELLHQTGVGPDYFVTRELG